MTREQQRLGATGVATILVAGALAVAGVSRAQAVSPRAMTCDGSEPQHALDQHGLDQQIAACTALIAQDPKSAEAFYHRGRARYYEGQYDSALADYDSAITLKPDYEGALNSRAYAYLRNGQYDQAIADCQHVLKLNPGDAVAAGWLRAAQKAKARAAAR